MNLTGLGGQLLGVGAGLIALLGTLIAGYLSAKKTGAKEQKLADIQKAVANVQVHNDVKAAVGSTGDGSAASELQSNWSRDK